MVSYVLNISIRRNYKEMNYKRFLAALACSVLVFSAACTSSGGNESGETTVDTEVEENSTESTTEESTESDDTSSSVSNATTPYVEPEYTALDYVTLGDYSSFEVSVNENDYIVKESDINDLIDEMIKNAAPCEDDGTKDTVEADSVIKADYVGRIDGEAFDGGSATDTYIDVANNSEYVKGYSFIDGFTAGLVGAKVGDTVDCPVTFPEDYSSEDLAGKDAVFTFTIKAIEKVYTHENIDDEYVNANLGYSTVSALKAGANDSLKTNKENTRKSDVEAKCVEQLKERSTVNSYPDDMLDSRFEYSYDRLENGILTAYSITIEEYAAYQGMTIDEYKDYLKEELKESAAAEMLLQAIVETEGLTVDEAGYNEYVNSLISNYSYDSTDALYQAYDKSYVEYGYLQEKAKDILYANATVTDSNDSASTESTESETETTEATTEE